MVFLCPYDEEYIKNIAQRAARDEDGEVYYVPEDTTYKEWEKAFVDRDMTKTQSIVKIHGKVYNKKSKKEFENVANNVKKEIMHYSNTTSKWSGNINIKEFRDNTAGVKEWSCDISVSKLADDGVIWHEMLHSCSASYYMPKVYAKNAAIEEASVEFLKQQICKEKDIENLSAYENQVMILRIVNSNFRYGTDMEFAKELFNIPLPDRYAWLEDKVDTSLGKLNVSLEDYNDVMSFLRNLEGGIKQ